MYKNESLLVNDNIRVYWKKNPSDTTSTINSPRSTNDDTKFKDRTLLQNFTLGQFLIVGRTPGQIILSEIVMEFSESHKAPPLKDCSEVYRSGATTPGWYHLDTAGNGFNSHRDEVYCEDGWTYILIRNPKEQQYGHVSFQFSYISCTVSLLRLTLLHALGKCRYVPDIFSPCLVIQEKSLTVTLVTVTQYRVIWLQ